MSSASSTPAPKRVKQEEPGVGFSTPKAQGALRRQRVKKEKEAGDAFSTTKAHGHARQRRVKVEAGEGFAVTTRAQGNAVRQRSGDGIGKTKAAQEDARQKHIKVVEVEKDVDEATRKLLYEMEKKLAPNGRFVTLQVSDDSGLRFRAFMRKTSCLLYLFDHYYDITPDVQRGKSVFFAHGGRAQEWHTPADFDLKDGDQIDVVSPQW